LFEFKKKVTESFPSDEESRPTQELNVFDVNGVLGK